MRGTLLLAIVIIWCQVIEGKKAAEILGVLRYELTDLKYDIQKRSSSDIWNSIKNTLNHVWENIKNLAHNTKNKIVDWITKIKIKAQDLNKAFRERLDKIKDRINEIINNVIETGEIVKKCLQDRKKEIDEILKNILNDVTNCISSSLNYLNNLSALQYGSIPNETEFFKNVQNDVYECLKAEKYEENDKVLECIQSIRKDIYKKMEMTEEYILRNHTETRGATDDLLNTIVECTTDGIIKSTNIIANETVHIIECAAKG